MSLSLYSIIRPRMKYITETVPVCYKRQDSRSFHILHNPLEVKKSDTLWNIFQTHNFNKYSNPPFHSHNICFTCSLFLSSASLACNSFSFFFKSYFHPNQISSIYLKAMHLIIIKISINSLYKPWNLHHHYPVGCHN